MKKYLSILIVCTLTFGCTEEWLSLYPTNRIADDQAVQTVSDGRAAMNGVYVRMKEYYMYGRNFFVCADVGCEDVVLRTDNSNRYVRDYRWDPQPGNVPGIEMWQYTYNAIKRANEVIQRLTGVTPDAGETVEERDHIVGEAYFIRALLHYELVKFFAQAYNHTSDASHLGIPYIEESTMEVDHPRLSVKVCFEKIIADAETALTMMDADKPANPYTAGKDAVRALLARVYLYMASTNNGANYAKAAQYAEQLINATIATGAKRYTLVDAEDYKITGSNTAFSSPKMWGADYSTESIFVLPYTPTERIYTNSLSNIYLDKNKGYGDLKPSEQLMALFDEEDSRFTIFYEYDKAMCSRKFMGTGIAGGFDLSNLNIFRLSEMYLIAAEGNAKASSPDPAKALTFLNSLKTNRGLEEVSLSGQALINEIILERRRELCFEGHALIDHKRLNTSIVRTEDETNPENQKFGLVYPHNYFAFPIPDTETNTNKLIEPNPGY